MVSNPYQNIWGKIISLPASTKIGAFVDIGEPDFGEDCVIQTMVSIPPGWKFGNKVFIGPGARFANDKHPNLDKQFEPQKGIVEDNVVIGMNATIGAGITIGKNAIIGMGSVVLKDVPTGEVWVGNPAKRLCPLGYKVCINCGKC